MWIASLLFGALTAVLGCSQDDSLQDPQLELPPQASSNQAVAVPEIELVTLIDSSEIYRVAGEYEKSLQCLEVVWRNYSELQSHRTRDQYHDAVGNLAFTTEAYDASLTAQMARFAFMDDNPFFSAVPMRISHALKKAGDTVKAIQWYRRTITSTAAPERIADARRNLAWLYISQKMYDSVSTTTVQKIQQKLPASVRGVDPMYVAVAIWSEQGRAWALSRSASLALASTSVAPSVNGQRR